MRGQHEDHFCKTILIFVQVVQEDISFENISYLFLELWQPFFSGRATPVVQYW